MSEKTLYDPSFEHDNCGVGFIADISGRISHDIIEKGLLILKNLEHRGASGSDPNSGDGAGILSGIPHDFFKAAAVRSGITLPERNSYGVGMLFMPRSPSQAEKIEKDITEIVKSRGGEILFWRSVPVSPECLGEAAKLSRPDVRQLVVKIGALSGDELEKELYIIRRSIEKKEEPDYSIEDFYIPSFSAYTIVYKGLFIAPQLEQFYPDLTDSLFMSCFAVVHQRYSTNTFPSWQLAQPFRYIAHNGEINTIRGNVSRMKAREQTIIAEGRDPFYEKVMPVVNDALSDSGCFDNVFELLLRSGRSAAHTVMMMIPEPFSSEYHISQDRRAFYQYHAALMEPWDGPAALVFTDGKMAAASLDRNGLRPARWTITGDNRFILASEAGVIPLEDENIRSTGRLSPGRMVIVDFTKKRVLYDNEIKASVTRQKPYRKWLGENQIDLKNMLQLPGENIIEKPDVNLLSSVFGYTGEDFAVTLKTMAETGHEPVISMGNDTPLAVLSKKPQLLYPFFRQFFAQVTNPPIDPLREKIVMSLMSFIGRERNLLEETPLHCRQIKLNHPVLTNDDIAKLIEIDLEGQRTEVLKMFYYCTDKCAEQLDEALSSLCLRTEEKIDMGATFVVLSDKNLEKGQIPIPALLAVSAVHNYLASKKKRQLAGLIVETGEAREVMHFAALINAGASAVNPYLAFELISYMKDNGKIEDDIKLDTAFENYIEAIKQGLLKIMSKMGISTIRSYRGAKTLEAVGLSSDFISRFFPGIVSRIGGIGLDEIASSTAERYSQAVRNAAGRRAADFPESAGTLHYRRGGEQHLMSPEAVVYLQRSVRSGDYELYKKYTEEIDNKSSRNTTLRSLFRFKKGDPVPVDEVEREDSIVKRFVSSAMSLGSLSAEAHHTLAAAMNALGSSSNSGEGGEEESRVSVKDGGGASGPVSDAGKIRQIASARFGVTSHYIANAEELQIKIAQGAKPGEGGQLPGYKVNELIASVRYSTPGVTLISPPPHHDIYSIEDLSQLIYDLKNANPEARISVKLVSEAGVGTIASGVAKAGADMVLISGHDGGTGAAPVSSVKYAGLPWELGLAETQQTLVKNSLRNKIRIQTDGQLRTGRDIAIASLLGAEEFGFGTVSLVCLGCIMMRKCHKNSCPVGIATQDEELRKRFAGKPEHLMNFMIFTARHLREIMANLGFRSLDEMTGRSDMLEIDDDNPLIKERKIDLSRLVSFEPVPDEMRKSSLSGNFKREKTDFHDPVEDALIESVLAKISAGEKAVFSSDISNINRSSGARLSWHVSGKFGPRGMEDGMVTARFRGNAGQSFGAFLAGGITFFIKGSLNDYPGKGLSGGIIAAFPPDSLRFRAGKNVIAGNAALYGATSGSAFFSGMAGERFCVRNSGALAVAEGTGDHGCEYMTGGTAVILGRTGINFAAGMSGGTAYVLDEDQLFDTRCNLEMVDIEPVSLERDKKELKAIISKHADYTGSELGRNILFHWEEMWPLFVKVIPFEYGSIMRPLWEQEEKELGNGKE